MNWMILPYRRYFDFSGRSRRKEYWMFTLFNVLVVIAINIAFGTRDYENIAGYVGFESMLSTTGGMLTALFRLFSLIPGLAVAVRRLHDQDRSGWLLLLLLIPLLGWFALLVLMCLDGTKGDNSYGPDPKRPGVDAEVFS